MKKLLAEAIGTFILVFAGTGAIVVNDVAGGSVTHVGISLTFGLVVLALVYSLGDVSGAHLNPAVTLGFFVAGRFSLPRVLPYIASQCAGALAASAAVRIMFFDHPTLGATLPAGDVGRAFAMETFLTFALMFVILNVASGAKEKGIMAGIAVGAVIALEALVGGPISGASMNPARSLAPALVSLRLEHLWIYLTAPIVGAGLGVAAWRLIQENPS
jgi:MIP family channel proteins